MADRVVIAVSKDGLLRARAARTTGLVAEALIRHLPATLPSLALGRALSAAAVVPVSWKDCERMSFQWSGRGPLGTVMVEFREPGRLRGLITVPDAELRSGYGGRRGIGYGLLPEGFLSVLRQAPNGSFVRSQVPLRNGEIDEDLEAWFEQSEQMPTRVRSFVELGADGLSVTASAVLVQALPGGEAAFPADAAILERLGAATGEEDLLSAAFGGREWEVVGSHPLVYACPCERERISAAIRLLGAGEIRDMIERDGGAKVRCDFCATSYDFGAEDLESILAALESSP